MDEKITKKVLVFYIVTFILTIMLVVLTILTNNMFISPQYAPTLSLLLICLIGRNWVSFKNMNWNLTRSKNWYYWILISFILPFLVIYLSSLVLTYFGLDYAKWTNVYSNHISLFIVIILGAIFEEIGWRGYLLPLFAKKYNWLKSSIIVGALWGIWHLSKILNGALGFLFFIIFIIELSVIMTWIYRKTKGNLILMIVFHLAVNFAALFFLSGRDGVELYLTADVIMGIICGLVVLTNKELFGLNHK